MTVDGGHRRIGFVRAFLASAAGTGLSRVVGAGREIAVAAVLGVGGASDAFNLAWTLPNAFRRFVADEGLVGALIPALARAEADGGDAELRRLGSAALMALVLVNVALCAVGMALAEPLVLAYATSWRDDPEQLALAVRLTRWMFPIVAMVSVVSYFEGLLNYRGHFFVPKLAPALISVGVIAAALALAPITREPAWALAVGTVCGGAAHVLVNLVPVARRWGRMPWVPLGEALASPRLRGVASAMSKVVAIGLLAQVNLLVLQQLATSLPPGSLTVYRNAVQLTDLAQGVVAVGIGSALLPNVATSASAGRWDTLRGEIVRALELAAFLLIPVAVALLVFAEPFTAMVLRVRRYTWEDAQRTAAALQCLAPFVLAIGGTNIVKKVYFALEDRRTLFAIGALGVALTGALGLPLSRSFGVRGVTLALSVSTSIQLGLYVVLLRRRLGPFGSGAFGAGLGRVALATVPLAAVLAAAAPFGRWANGPVDPWNWAVFGTAGVAAAAAYVLAGWALGVRQVGLVAARLAARLRR